MLPMANDEYGAPENNIAPLRSTIVFPLVYRFVNLHNLKTTDPLHLSSLGFVLSRPNGQMYPNRIMGHKGNRRTWSKILS